LRGNRQAGELKVGAQRPVEVNQETRELWRLKLTPAAEARCIGQEQDDGTERQQPSVTEDMARMPTRAERRVWSHPSRILSIYLAITIVMTWPLVTVMDRRIAGDMGDPLFCCWILLWTGGQVLRALHGDLYALTNYWNGNIFYPAPLTVGYSEHLAPQMLQALPILASTGNVILAYNIVLLGTFALSGLAMYLFVHEITGQPFAAFFAGLAFAFAPYRADQYSHLQVLSSQWMPFTLYGLTRFFATGRVRPLIGSAVAFLAQALSSAYYLVYFAPFAFAYGLYEMAAQGKISDVRLWRLLLLTGGAAVLVLGAFAWPYAVIRRLGDVGVRDIGAIQQYSFDTHAFATITPSSKLLGSVVNAMQRNEGQGFLGFTILVFAAIAFAVTIARGALRARAESARPAAWRRVAAVVVGLVILALIAVLSDVLVDGRATRSMRRLLPLERDAGTRIVALIAVAGAVLLGISAFVRRWARTVLSSRAGFCSVAAIAAAWLTLGPVMYANRRPIGPGLYYLLYRFVPGIDGLRVPSRNLMIASLFLAVLVGLAGAALIEFRRGIGRALVAVGMITLLAEVWAVPTSINVRLHGAGLAWPSADLAGRDLTPVYRLVRSLPEGTVLAEFPFADPANEIRYVFYSGYHRKPIINGYSGFSPEHYTRLAGALADVPTSDESWAALVESGATHAIVHEAAYLDRDGREVSAWLRREGAHEIADLHPDHLFEVRQLPR